MTGDQKVRLALVNAVVVLALACIAVPSWPLAAGCAVVAGVFVALVWEADRQRRVETLFAQVATIEEALKTHKVAIADLKQALVSRRLSDNQPVGGQGLNFGFGSGR